MARQGAETVRDQMRVPGQFNVFAEPGLCFCRFESPVSRQSSLHCVSLCAAPFGTSSAKVGPTRSKDAGLVVG